MNIITEIRIKILKEFNHVSTFRLIREHADHFFPCSPDLTPDDYENDLREFVKRKIDHYDNSNRS